MSEYSEAFDKAVLLDAEAQKAHWERELRSSWTHKTKQQVDRWTNIVTCIKALKYKEKEYNEKHLGNE